MAGGIRQRATRGRGDRLESFSNSRNSGLTRGMTVRELTQTLWTVDEVAAYLRVPVTTIYQWRTRGYGPVGRRVGRHLRYRAEDVARWVDGLAEGRAA